MTESTRDVQTKLVVGASNDQYEREADHVADAITRNPRDTTPDVLLPRTSSRLRIGRSPASDVRGNSARSDWQIDLARSGGGQPLTPRDRRFFEDRFEAPFDGVRVHTGARAHTAADALNARAFTVGRDIVFDAGQYRPGTREGRHLLAHELTHVLQQRAAHSVTLVQRENDTAASDVIGANEIIPFPEGSRVTFGRMLAEWMLDVLREAEPETAAMLETLDRKVGEVRVATPDRFEAVVTEPVTLPSSENGPSRTMEDVRVILAREGASFTFQVTAQVRGEAGRTTRITLREQHGLTAERSGGDIVLSSTGEGRRTRQLRVREPESGVVQLGVFGESIPQLRGLAGDRVIDAIRITRLEPAETNAEIERQVEAIAESQSAARRTRSQELSVGGGLGLTGSGDPLGLLTTSWRMRFTTSGLFESLGVSGVAAAGLGNLVGIPLEVQLLYAPDTSILGTVGTGLDLRIPTEVPVNVRLTLLGIGGGALEPEPGAERQATLGLPLGAGVGAEIGLFRVNLRWDALFNLLPGGTTVHSFTATGGFAF